MLIITAVLITTNLRIVTHMYSRGALRVRLLLGHLRELPRLREVRDDRRRPDPDEHGLTGMFDMI